MKSISEPSTDAEAMASLVKKCQQLCQSADSTIAKLSTESESFLAQNLGDALQQLELILRALGEEQSPFEGERQGFLKRLFAKAEAEGVENQDPRQHHFSQQGLQGNSWTIPLSDLIGFLAYGGKTGVLWVDSPEENFLFGLVDGNVSHATSDKTPEGLRIGEILVSLGYLTGRQLERFLANRGDNEQPVSGELLLDAGMISDDELRDALRYQTQQLFHRLVNTKNAVFRFREGMQVLLAYQVEMDVNTLLLESARTHDEISASTERAQMAEKDWGSWQAELGTELSTVVDADLAQALAEKNAGQATEEKGGIDETSLFNELSVLDEKPAAEAGQAQENTGSSSDSGGSSASSNENSENHSSQKHQNHHKGNRHHGKGKK